MDADRWPLTRKAIAADEQARSLTPLPETGPDLGRRNRRIIAERLHWPAGALDDCERLDAERPGWWIVWMAANDRPGFEHPSGLFATRSTDGYKVHGDDAEALSAAIGAAPSPAEVREMRWH